MIPTFRVVQQQILAMRSETFEVGLFRPSSIEEQGRSAAMVLRTWDTETLLHSVSWLRFENKVGRNIYVRPAGEHQLSLVDNVSAQNIERMGLSGFRPAAIVETSPGNFQAWLNHGQRLTKELGTVVARALAKEFQGDAKAADWRHFGRLAGFTNQKPAHRMESGLFPYVRLIEATGQVYTKANEFVGSVQQAFEAEQKTRREHLVASIQPGSRRGSLKSIDDFRQRDAYGGDGTRSDLAYALYAISRGLSEAEIKAAIRSRDLSHKGGERRQDAYVERTLRKALTLRQVSR